jgi:hypothetical protein
MDDLEHDKLSLIPPPLDLIWSEETLKRRRLSGVHLREHIIPFLTIDLRQNHAYASCFLVSKFPLEWQ